VNRENQEQTSVAGLVYTIIFGQSVLYQLIHITAKLEQLPVYPEDSHHARTLETESWWGPTVMAGPKIHLDKIHDTYMSTPSQVST
jgi:hypothetical protein